MTFLVGNFLLYVISGRELHSSGLLRGE